jgi:hypothetical protein
VDARAHGVRSVAIGASSGARGGQADGRAGDQQRAVRIGVSGTTRPDSNRAPVKRSRGAGEQSIR